MLTINKRGMVEGVAVRPTPNKSGALKPALVVMHDTAGAIDNDSSIDWLCNPQARASAHFVIDRKGKITQLAACTVKTWHAGKSIWRGQQNCNDFSIGIEHVNPGKLLAGGRSAWGKTYDTRSYKIQEVATPHHGAGWWMPYTEAQLASSLDLLLSIRDTYGVEYIAPHWEISPGRKVDVNPLFPLAQFRAKLEGRKDGKMLIQSKPGAVFRKWPSFNKENILKLQDDDGWFDPVKSGVFEVTGKELPDSLATEHVAAPQLWYQVMLQAKDQPDTEAWLWSGDVKETRA